MVSQSEKEEIKKNGIDINIVLDVSYSMLASDLKPNRLEVSKDIISKFIKELKTDRV
jgi:Ca-activated chloride channel homolog